MIALSEARRRAGRWLSFYFQSQTIYDIHSPAVFRLAREMVENRKTYYILQEARQLRRIWLRDRRTIERLPRGAGSRAGLDRSPVAVRDLARHMAISPRAGRYLFHLARLRHPRLMLDLGTGLGFSAAYLAGGSLSGTCITAEGCAQTAALARQSFSRLKLNNIRQLQCTFDEAISTAVSGDAPIDLLHLDGDHRRKAVEQLWRTARPHLHRHSVVAISDIRWSEDMESAWEWLKGQPGVTYTVDLFDLGLLFLEEGPVNKAHYRLVPARCKPWRLGFWPRLPAR